MNKLSIIIITVWVTASPIFSNAQNEEGGKVFTESVDVHINADFLITGETLYFSVHCLGPEKNKTSTLSKLVYVELVGENEKPFLQTKVPMVEGRGGGDFFLPSALPSGNYTLIAYTKWMRNFPVANFFQKQVTIINPYRKPVISESQDKTSKNTVFALFSNPEIRTESSQVQFAPDKKKFSQREKVVVVVKNNDHLQDCKISLSVRLYHKTNETGQGVLTSDSLNKRNSHSAQTSQLEKKFVTFLPDLRGETIGGIAQESVSHKPIANTNIYLSAPGSNTFQISRTDSAGRFYFSTKNIQTQTGIRFQVDWQSESVPFEVILPDEFVNDYKNFRPLPLSIDTSLRRRIEQHNVYGQIENAYFTYKHDSILSSQQEPFFGTPDKVYNLDDFTRFPTMEDIFREYMYEVVLSKREEKFSLWLLNNRSGFRFLNTPLILIDGVRVIDIETLMNYNPLLINNISLITRQYVYAGFLFDGILSVHTYAGNAKELPIATVQKDYTSWQHPKKYYSPVYQSKNLDRIPDYRVQLFWNPTIKIEPGQEFVAEFYTSDIDGYFLMEAKGFTSNGEVVNIRDTIEVLTQLFR